MKLLVTTGFGNIIQRGADVWTNHFINLVLPDYQMIILYL